MATTYRAAVIGRTGRGNYGHKIHRAYEGMSNVQVVAIADPDPDGRQQAAKETGAEHLYADYREMLEAEDLDEEHFRERWRSRGIRFLGIRIT